MPTIGDRNAARAQRNADRNAAIQQENARNNAFLEMEDRLRELEARNAMLESRMEAMGDVVARQALAQQQVAQEQVEPQLAVNQSSGPAMMNGAVEDVGIGRLPKVSVRKSLGSLVKKYIMRYRVN